MEHRRLKILFAIISLFAFMVIAWYFLFEEPKAAPTLGEVANPLSLRDLPARIGFIFRGEDPEQTTETEVTQSGPAPFKLVWSKPTTGNVFVSKQILKEVTATTTSGTSTVSATRTVRATTTVLMFVDRITGYVYGHSIETGTTYQISNTTVPGIYDAYIFAGGEKVLMRYLDADRETIRSILATIPNVQEGRDPQSLTAVTNLPQNIVSVAVSSSLSSLAYLVRNDLGSSVYSVSSRGTTKIADSPFSEWILSYGGEALYATTKASAYIEGVTVSLPNFVQVLGGKTGLVATPSSQGILLASMWSSSGLLLFGGQNGTFITAAVRTVASKCASLASSQFLCGVPKNLPREEEGLPDDWYQGKVLFDDRLVMVDAASGETHTVYDFESQYGAIDVTQIKMNASGELVSFIRKQNSSLYLLNTPLMSAAQSEE